MVRVGIGGVIATTVDFVLMVLLVELASFPVGVAAFLGAGGGALTSYWISKLWAFNDRSRIHPKQVASFAMVSFVTALIVGPSVHMLHDAGVHYTIAKVIAAVTIFFCWSYPAQSRIVFRRARFAPSRAQ